MAGGGVSFNVDFKPVKRRGKRSRKKKKAPVQKAKENDILDVSLSFLVYFLISFYYGMPKFCTS